VNIGTIMKLGKEFHIKVLTSLVYTVFHVNGEDLVRCVSIYLPFLS
jgi:hypothetical protein